MVSDRSALSVAVIGGGVAGITAAHLLSQRYAVTLFERNDYLGGHTNTRVVQSGPDEGTAVDTGFIVCNPVNYPNFYKLLKELGVVLRDSDMSFGYGCSVTGLQYVGPAVSDFLLTPQNLLRPAFLRMIFEQRRFNQKALKDLAEGNLSEKRLGQYLRENRTSEYFSRNYLVPLAASIWSSPDSDINDFPAETFVTFFRNHGMLELSKRPTWQTVVGGSHSYVKAFQEAFSGELHLDSPVRSVRRGPDNIAVTLSNGQVQQFDRVILATHADESLAMIENPLPNETQVLSKWHYHKSRVVLHTDSRVLPQPRRLWASWNYIRRKNEMGGLGVPITYYMNRLQGLKTNDDYFVTLNADENQIDSQKVLYETVYTHPAYTPEAVGLRAQLSTDLTQNRISYCGSYLGYGFHEDAVSSAVRVAAELDCLL